MKTDETFDNVHSNFIKICSDKGIDTEAAEAFIENVMKLMPEDERSFFASQMIFLAINWGTKNAFEAIGMLEVAKRDYMQLIDDMHDDEMNEE